MAKWKQIVTHDSLIEVDTGNALLIRLPQLINEKYWGVWIPKSLVRLHDKNHEIQINYAEGFIFNIATIDKELNDKSTLKEKDIIKQFKDFDLENANIKTELDISIKSIQISVDNIYNQLKLLQEVDGIPLNVDELVREADLSNLELLVKNLHLIKNRL